MNVKEFLLDTLFPPRCLLCGSSRGDHLKAQSACNACLDQIATHGTLFCITCRARLADDIRICHTNTPLRLAAVGRYDDVRLQSLITQLKYQRRTAALKALAILTRRYLAELLFDFATYTIIPIPLHPKRQRERGFNQSLLISEHVSSMLNCPILRDVLEKTRPTKAQAETKNVQERRNNLQNCFSVRRPELIAGKKIVLVDDVCTSGATLTEAAETLKRAGAKNIIGFVMAQTG